MDPSNRSASTSSSTDTRQSSTARGNSATNNTAAGADAEWLITTHKVTKSTREATVFSTIETLGEAPFSV